MACQILSLGTADLFCQYKWNGIPMSIGSSTSSWKLEMNEVWFDTFDEGYVHQFQLEPAYKIQNSQ